MKKPVFGGKSQAVFPIKHAHGFIVMCFIAAVLSCFVFVCGAFFALFLERGWKFAQCIKTCQLVFLKWRWNSLVTMWHACNRVGYGYNCTVPNQNTTQRSKDCAQKLGNRISPFLLIMSHWPALRVISVWDILRSITSVNQYPFKSWSNNLIGVNQRRYVVNGAAFVYKFCHFSPDWIVPLDVSHKKQGSKPGRIKNNPPQ